MTDQKLASEPADEELLEQYRRGAREALGLLVARHQRVLYSFILRMTAGQADADEVFQETWFHAIRRLESYHHRNFRAWLFRIGHNLVIDRLRARRKMVSLDGNSDDEEGGTLAETIPAAGPDPAAACAAREGTERIKAAVLELPAEQRAVFLMRMEAEMSFKEIARVQGVSINTALARMQYAIGKLRQVLRAEYATLKERQI